MDLPVFVVRGAPVQCVVVEVQVYLRPEAVRGRRVSAKCSVHVFRSARAAIAEPVLLAFAVRDVPVRGVTAEIRVCPLPVVARVGPAWGERSARVFQPAPVGLAVPVPNAPAALFRAFRSELPPGLLPVL